MPTIYRGGARRRALAVLTVGALAAGAAATTTTATASPAEPTTSTATAPEQALGAGRYVVLLAQPAATRYAGGVAGLAPTQAPKGNKFDAQSDKVEKYTRFLERKHGQVAGSVGADVLTETTIASNSFTTTLSADQATELAADRDVLMMAKDTAFAMDTWNTPRFLGLESASGTGTGGVWAATGGVEDAGRGVVVGILDSGIWPESASFAGKQLKSKRNGKFKPYRSGSTIVMEKADGTMFRGACELGEQWDASDCNEKLIGARYYPEAFVASVPPEDRYAEEFLSTRDGDGHGSHTAGTAAGNFGVPASVEGRDFGTVSGMAPAAKIAAYKVCFSDNDPDTGGCYTSSTLDAVDDAIADGVDVINYSISGATSHGGRRRRVRLPRCRRCRRLRRHLGRQQRPTASTVAHNSPWVTTVAASTHAVFENTVVLGNGAEVQGRLDPSTAGRPAPLVNSSARRPCRPPPRTPEAVRAGQPRPRQGDRQGRGLRPRRLRPGRQERRGRAGRRRRDGARQHHARQPGLRLPRGADRAPRPGVAAPAIKAYAATPAPRLHSNSVTPRAALRPCRRSPASPRADRRSPTTPTSSSPTSRLPA